MGLLIRDPRPEDEPAWRRLWAGYCAFYEADVPEAVTAATWAKIFEPQSTIHIVGPLDDVELYARRAALAVVDQIATPLLVMHGTDDPVVPVEGTVAFVDALQARGGDVELHLFDGEGHGFRQTANQLAEYRLVGAFLDRVVR